MATLYFVRHAHSPWNPNREAERPLSERGHRDVERVAAVLADEKIDAVVSSPVADGHGMKITEDEGYVSGS